MRELLFCFAGVLIGFIGYRVILDNRTPDQKYLEKLKELDRHAAEEALHIKHIRRNNP